MRNNPNLVGLVNVNIYTNLVKFYQFVLKILSRNEIMTDEMHKQFYNLGRACRCLNCRAKQ